MVLLLSGLMCFVGCVEVVVIGGGVIGCLCVLMLVLNGVCVCLYEVCEIVGGVSGCNGGFVFCGVMVLYDCVWVEFGMELVWWLMMFIE